MTCTGLNYVSFLYYNIWLVGTSPFWCLLFKQVALQSGEHKHSFFGVILCLIFSMLFMGTGMTQVGVFYLFNYCLEFFVSDLGSLWFLKFVCLH